MTWARGDASDYGFDAAGRQFGWLVRRRLAGIALRVAGEVAQEAVAPAMAVVLCLSLAIGFALIRGPAFVAGFARELM